MLLRFIFLLLVSLCFSRIEASDHLREEDEQKRYCCPNLREIFYRASSFFVKPKEQKTTHPSILPPEIWQDIWSYLKSDVIFRQALSSHAFMHYVKKHCQALNFSDNLRVNQFPTVIFDFRSLRELYFKHLVVAHDQFDLPPDLLVLTNLTKLSVKGFKLKHSIESILVLTSLKSLSLLLNNIEHLSENLSLLTNLQNLKFCNQFTNLLPESIATLTRLTSLDVSFGGIESLPRNLSKLTNLRLLNFGSNLVGLLPNVIYRMTSLTTLNLSGCRLSTLSDDLSGLSNLTELNLRGNPFSQNEFLNVVFKITSLRILDIRSCANFLTETDYEDNKYTLPAIQHLPNLTCLNGIPFNKMDLEEVSQPSLVGQDQPITIVAYLMANPDFNHLANELLDLSRALVTLAHADNTRVEEVD